jgi:CheY-like chemotaxis protein
MEKQRILLVEDNAQFRENFARALERALAAEPLDVTFVEVGSLAEARERLREGGLDAALIDVRLPDGDGLDLVRELNDGAAGRIPTLVLTAYLDHTSAIGCPGDRRGCEGCSLQGGFGTGDHRGNKEADRQRTLGGLKHRTGAVRTPRTRLTATRVNKPRARRSWKPRSREPRLYPTRYFTGRTIMTGQ